MSDKKEKIKLEVEKRKVTGRQVKILRRDGLLPANIYGKKTKSLAVQADLKSFLPVLKQAGETTLVELKVAGEDKARPVLIHNVQYHPLNEQPLHADFYEVNLKEKVTTRVEIELVGESLAVKEKIGILIQPLTEIEVEALPTDLPEKLQLEISSLKQIGDALTVGDIKAPERVTLLTEQKETLVKIDPPAKEEEVVVAAPAEGEEGEEAEGEEGEEKKEEKGEETKGGDEEEKGEEQPQKDQASSQKSQPKAE